jgi:hypothetical protein
VLLLPAAEGELVSLTGTGVTLWELLAEPVELAELSAILSQAYATRPDVIATDIQPVLDELVRRGLIEASG